MARGADLPQGVIIAIGAPITQSHNSHNSHNSHIKRRPIDFANRSGYTEFWCKKSPQRYAGQRDGNGGVRVAGARRLLMDQVDQMDLMDKMGAPRYTPRVCCAAVWLGAGENVPVGDAGGTHGYSGGCQGDSLVPLTGRATPPTATRLFLPSFFSPGKKAVRGP